MSLSARALYANEPHSAHTSHSSRAEREPAAVSSCAREPAVSLSSGRSSGRSVGFLPALLRSLSVWIQFGLPVFLRTESLRSSVSGLRVPLLLGPLGSSASLSEVPDQSLVSRFIRFFFGSPLTAAAAPVPNCHFGPGSPSPLLCF